MLFSLGFVVNINIMMIEVTKQKKKHTNNLFIFQEQPAAVTHKKSNLGSNFPSL